jgi:hypothetical protein
MSAEMRRLPRCSCGVPRLSYSTIARHLSPLFLPSSSLGTTDAASLVELVYRVGWSHLVPLTANSASPLAWYRDAIYALPLDIYAVYVLIISVAIFAWRHIWRACIIGGEKKWQ